MHAFLSIIVHATPVALALVAVAALFAALRPGRLAPAAEAALGEAALAAKPAPAEPLAETGTDTPAVAHGGHAKGQNLDLFGGWPEGYLNRVERGIGIEKLQKAYGHSSPSITMAYICIQDEEMKAMYREAL